MSILYEINNMQCSYDGKKIVLKINNLTIEQGKVVFFVGPSGVGKSTLLETLGLMNDTIHSVGTFQYNDTDLQTAWSWSDKKLSAMRNKEFSFIFQQNNLMPNFTAQENVLTAALFQGEKQNTARQRMKKVLEDLELPSDDRPIHNFSGGQLQRIAFARAILPAFSVIFGDEPTGNLDGESAKVLMDILINAVHERKSSAIIVSHDISLATKYADEIVHIRKCTNEQGQTYGLIDTTSLYIKTGTQWLHNGELLSMNECQTTLTSQL